MKEFDPVREFIFDYITVIAECTLAIAVIGSIFARKESISFLYFFLPFGLAFMCMIRSIAELRSTGKDKRFFKSVLGNKEFILS